MKKIINRLPGGESKLKSLVAALFLVKEYYQNNERSTSLMEERYNKLLEMLENNVYLVEEEIIVNRFLNEDAVANVTGAGVSTDVPAPLKKNVDKYKNIVRRKKPAEVA